MGEKGESRANWKLILCTSLFSAAYFVTVIHGSQNSDALQPPIGNSLVMKLKTGDGRMRFKCSSGEWFLVGAASELVQASDPSIRVGLYSSSASLKDQTTASATWILSNPPDVAAESGYSNSSVTGKETEVRPSGGFISEALLQATAHQYNGVASIISYVQRVSPQGGDPPAKQTCMKESSTVHVPFEAEFWLWKQDAVPPSAPAAISLTQERVVEGMFGEGGVTYRFDGSSWQEVQAEASLYSIPGGTSIGKYTLRAAAAAAAGKNGQRSAASYSWRSSSPNGFRVVGKVESEPVLVDNNCLAWSLVAVTSSSTVNSVGAYSHVQMVSTKGGLPPSPASSSDPLSGDLTTSPFSAIFWFYTKS